MLIENPCFVAGTLIATPDGERAIETLAIGDLLRTADGRDVPVRFIGLRTASKTFTPADLFAPVRVRAGALGGGMPHSDLVLTGDHALILDGYAINAAALINGTTILREPMDALPESITYYQIETDAHETIFAMGAAAETLVDYGSRRAFDNFDDYIALYGSERVIAEMDACRITARHQLPAALRARIDGEAAA